MNDAENGRESEDIAALAKGGRANVLGFVMRLAARMPFLFIAGRIYGAEALGRFAYAALIAEFASQLATLGLKRGLAAGLAQTKRSESHVVADALVLSGGVATLAALILFAFPGIMFPTSELSGFDRLLPLATIMLAIIEVSLASCAWRFDIAASVRTRAVLEPWTLSICSLLFSFYTLRDGLILSYVVSLVVALVVSCWSMSRHYGWPSGWRLKPMRLWRMARINLPLAAADAVEWGTRRLDMAILGLFVSPAVVGVYYIAQQVATLPQKLKTSFEPVLGPVITRNLKEGNLSAIAAQVSQVGFWIVAAQLGIALALGVPGKAVTGLLGPQFVGGALALACLLAAEVLASTAVVSESALVYIARHRNLMISLLSIAVQAGLSFVFILYIRAAGLPDMVMAAAPALALAIGLGLSSLIKARLLSHLLGSRISTWRPILFVAGGLTAGIGALFASLPQSLEWVQLGVGFPVMMAAYFYIIWRYAFGPDDRALFQKKRT